MFFNKKKKEEQIQKNCNHKWKDFPWYIDSVWYSDTKRLDAKFIEPYVCIYCKERKDVILSEISRIDCSFDEANEVIESFKEQYKNDIKDKLIVNDMISDMQLVDKEYLELYNNIVKP